MAGLTLAGLLLAGCSKQPAQPVAEDQAPVVNDVIPPEANSLAEAPQAEQPRNEVKPVPLPEEKVSADAQMMEDADAVGMTSHLPPAEEATAGDTVSNAGQ